MIKGRYTVGPFRKILLLGGGQLLAQLSEWAKANGFGIGVITSPRHAIEEVGGEALEQALKRLSIEFSISEKLDASVLGKFLSKPEETFSLSLGAAWIFNAKLIKDVFKDNLFNLHGTRLPQDRGGGGFSWQILTGNRFGFCNIHKMEPALDAGDIILSREFIYPPSCRTPSHYSEIYVQKCLEFVSEFLLDLRSGKKTLDVISQPEYLSSYWPRLSTETNGWIDWRWTPFHIERFICAFDDPYAGAQTEWNGKRIFLKKASINLQDARFHPFQSGIVYRKTGGWICIAADGAGLVVEQVVDEANVSLIDQINVGDRFHTPRHFLDDSRKRVAYSPLGIKERKP